MKCFLPCFFAGGEVKYLTHRIDALDKEKMMYSYTIIEGDAMDKIESISYEISMRSPLMEAARARVLTSTTQKEASSLKKRRLRKPGHRPWVSLKLWKPISWQILMPMLKQALLNCTRLAVLLPY